MATLYCVVSLVRGLSLHDLTKITGVIVFHTKSLQLITKVLYLNTVTRKSPNYPASGHVVQSPSTDAYLLSHNSSLCTGHVAYRISCDTNGNARYERQGPFELRFQLWLQILVEVEYKVSQMRPYTLKSIVSDIEGHYAFIIDEILQCMILFFFFLDGLSFTILLIQIQ